MSGGPAAPEPAQSPPDALEGRAYLRLIAIGGLIGIPAALLAAGFLAIVHQLENWLWDDLPRDLGGDSPQWYLVIGLPVAGALVVIVARTFLPGDGGNPPLKGIGGDKPTPLQHGPGIVLAAIGTLCFGAVLGPEAPLIALGSLVGVAASRLVRVGPKENQVLGTAGSFSAISALFGGPIVAGMMMLEGGVGLGKAALPALLPGLVAAAIGYVLFVGLGSWAGLDQTTLAVQGLPEYNGTHILDLCLAVVIGIVTALLVAAVRRSAGRIEALRDRVSMPALLLSGALAVGLLAQLAQTLGGDSQEVLFSGQAALPEIDVETSAKVVVVVLLVKAAAYAVSLGCGFRGGPVFPAIFLGVAVAMLAVIALDVSPTLAVATGAGAGMAAGTRFIFTSMLFAGLLVGHAGLDAIPAAVLAIAAAWLTVSALDRRVTRDGTRQPRAGRGPPR